jgi:DNA repair protein RadC
MEQPEKFSIKNWSKEDRPREKLLLKGTSSLSPAELLAILIGSGNRDESAVDLSKRILRLANDNINELAKFDINTLKKIKGIGEAKAVTIIAALELGRRRNAEKAIEQETIVSSKQAFEYLQSIIGDLKHEESHFITLNQASKIIALHKTSQGGMAGTVMDPRLILKQALMDNASKIILAHNHPSGNLQPSEADKSITNKIKESAKLMDIALLDHLIITQTSYFSFADEGLL